MSAGCIVSSQVTQMRKDITAKLALALSLLLTWTSPGCQILGLQTVDKVSKGPNEIDELLLNKKYQNEDATLQLSYRKPASAPVKLGIYEDERFFDLRALRLLRRLLYDLPGEHAIIVNVTSEDNMPKQNGGSYLLADMQVGSTHARHVNSMWHANMHQFTYVHHS